MKKFIALCLLILTVVISLPAMSQKHKKVVKVQTGTMVNFPKGSTTYVLVPDADPNKRYVIEQLGEQYKVDGLKVEFDGAEGTIPPNVRMVGIPYRVKFLQVKK